MVFTNNIGPIWIDSEVMPYPHYSPTTILSLLKPITIPEPSFSVFLTPPPQPLELMSALGHGCWYAVCGSCMGEEGDESVCAWRRWCIASARRVHASPAWWSLPCACATWALLAYLWSLECPCSLMLVRCVCVLHNNNNDTCIPDSNHSNNDVKIVIVILIVIVIVICSLTKDRHYGRGG